jgi:tryptophan synthase alpha chain
MNSIEKISRVFTSCKENNKAVLMPYFSLGFPDPSESINIIEGLSRSGADILELGIPFSDPIADGPTIQYSTQVALSHGVNTQTCLDMVRELRSRGIEQPILLMGYFNPILNFGIKRFVEEAFAAGVDGFIVPDLPPEEADPLYNLCKERNLAVVYMISLTTEVERTKIIAEKTTGFLYLVSVKGVTGARNELPDELASLIRRVQLLTNKPVAVGFGISTISQIKMISKLADGVIIGSVLINQVKETANYIDSIEGLMNQFDIARNLGQN